MEDMVRATIWGGFLESALGKHRTTTFQPEDGKMEKAGKFLFCGVHMENLFPWMWVVDSKSGWLHYASSFMHYFFTLSLFFTFSLFSFSHSILLGKGYIIWINYLQEGLELDESLLQLSQRRYAVVGLQIAHPFLKYVNNYNLIVKSSCCCFLLALGKINKSTVS